METLPLSWFPFYSPASLDEARDALARVYADGQLTPVGSTESFLHHFNVAPVGRVTLTAMEWGCGIVFQAPSLEDCFDFSSIVYGTAEIRVGREIVDGDPHTGVVMSPSKSLRIRWDDRLLSLKAKGIQSPGWL